MPGMISPEFRPEPPNRAENAIAVLIILTFLFGLGTGVLLAFLRPWKRKGG